MILYVTYYILTVKCLIYTMVLILKLEIQEINLMKEEPGLTFLFFSQQVIRCFSTDLLLILSRRTKPCIR